jgi:hypothetical protein
VEEASTMGDSRTWGDLPEFAWPSVGDRAWVEGRWVFDCGHPALQDPSMIDNSHIVDPLEVRYDTEIHLPWAVVTYRRNHPVASGSWLPVTGQQTGVPVTEADVFVSGNGGGDIDICSLYLAQSVLYSDGYNSLICHVGTGSLCLLAARPVEVGWRAVCLPEEFSAHQG